MSYYVYKFLDEENNVVYVGKTRRAIKQRLTEHFRRGFLPKEELDKVKKIEYVLLKESVEADVLEVYMIKKIKPKLNKTFNNDRGNVIFNVNEEELMWIKIREIEFVKIKGEDIINTDKLERESISELVKENMLLKEMINDFYSGDAYEYRDFLSEKGLKEDIKKFGFYLKPELINNENLITLLNLLKKDD